MSAQTNRSELEIREDPAYQRSEWRAERLGWAVWAAVLIAALVGLLGPGPYSSASERSSDQQLAIEYDRITRRRADSEIQIQVSPQLAREGQVLLYTTANFLANEAIETIQPQPREVLHAGGKVVHVFPTSSTSEPVVIKFRTHPGRVGRHEYTFGVEGGPALRFWRFVLP
jgi:hypothetical protein